MLVVHSSPPASCRLCIGDVMPISHGQFTAKRRPFANEMNGMVVDWLYVAGLFCPIHIAYVAYIYAIYIHPSVYA